MILIINAVVAWLMMAVIVATATADPVNVDELVEFDMDESTVTGAQETSFLRGGPSGVVDPSTTFNIALGFTAGITAVQKQAFLSARTKWQSIIVKDFAASVCVPAGHTACGYKFPRATCIDDLFIGVKIRPMDGVGKIAGSAGPCAVDAGGKVRMGVMTFDSADAAQLIKDGIWEATILHEMGHVLGIGTLWGYFNVFKAPMTARPPFYYQGVNGNQALVAQNGGEGNIVIEDLYGPGTARAHWKEATYDDELMTGYLERRGTPMPLSAFTVGSLADLGYTVDITKADPYTVPSSRKSTRAPSKAPTARTHAGKISLGNDIAEVTIAVLSEFKHVEIKAKPGREMDLEHEHKQFKHKQSRHQEDRNHAKGDQKINETRGY